MRQLLKTAFISYSDKAVGINIDVFEGPKYYLR